MVSGTKASKLLAQVPDTQNKKMPLNLGTSTLVMH
jgi:hypothetical protein